MIHKTPRNDTPNPAVPVSIGINNIRLDSTPCTRSHFEADINLVRQIQFERLSLTVFRDGFPGELATDFLPEIASMLC